MERRPEPLPQRDQTSPLSWLAEHDEYPKVLIWDRDRDEWSAGFGASAIHCVEDPAPTAALERSLMARAAAEPPGGPGWVGGVRFAAEREPGPTWRAFGASWWIRPHTWWTRRDGVDRTGVEPERVTVDRPASTTLSGESPDVYLARVRAALDEMHRSKLEKIVLSRCVLNPRGVDAAATLEKMAANEPGGTVYWLALDEHEGFFGVTPETLYRRRAAAVETEALAATAGPSDRDSAALLTDDKSQREHAYVRDAILDALAPVADEVHVATSPELHRMARLHHLRTPIRAQLRDAAPLLSRLHPTPAVCGTPYAEAEAAIARLEQKDRGLYAGAVGWCQRDGESIYVALRGARYTRDACAAYLGAGIVLGSVPEDELRELDLKAEALFASFVPQANEATS